MATLKQNQNQYTSYLGWYGICNETDKNTTFELKNLSEIHVVFRTNKGSVKSYTSGAPDIFQSVTHLEPGNCYWITLKPSASQESSIEIPGFKVGDKEDIVVHDNPSMISDCSGENLSEPTPTPIPTPTPTQTQTQTPTQTPTPEPDVVKPTKKIVLPVILYGWDTSDAKKSLHFTSYKLKWANKSERYATLEDINKLFNGEKYSWPYLSGARGITGSIKEYYKELSFGQLDVEFEFLPCGKAEKPTSNDPNDYAYLIDGDFAEYGEKSGNDPRGNRNTKPRPYKKIHAEFSKMFSRARLNLRKQGRNYDKEFRTDTPITFINAGFSAASTGNMSYIWPHKYAFLYNGRWRKYNVNPFLENLSSPARLTNATISTIGVIAHETLHTFGLPDLYDSGSDSRTRGSGTTKLSVMASGSYGNARGWSPYLPSFPISWTRRFLSEQGLFDTEVVDITKTTADIEIDATCKVNKLYRIKHPETNDYWWIEYRDKDAEGNQGINFDKMIMESGLAIVHEADKRDGGRSSNAGSRTPVHRRGESGYHISIEGRDGKFETQHGSRFINNDMYVVGSEFSPHTIPSTVSRSGKPSGIKVHNIRKENNKMIFDVTYLTEPEYKISEVDYNFSRTSYPMTSSNRTVLKVNTYGSEIEANLKTIGIPNGTKITMAIYGQSKNSVVAHGLVSNNNCKITTTTSELRKIISPVASGKPGHIQFKIDADSEYADAFAWNDYIRVMY